jgi:glucosamine kinase
MNLPSHIRYVVGVDCGGTSTRARLTHPDGVVLGEGWAGSSGLVQGIPQAWRHIQQAIDHAGESTRLSGASPPQPGNTAVGIGLAGFNNPTWRTQFLAANPGYTTLAVDTDVFTALLGAHQGHAGAVVILGTGSIGHALFADGRRTTAGGWGFPCGDEGGGAVLGLQAMRLTQHALDGRCPPSALAAAVQQLTGSTAQEVLDWSGRAGQREYATLAPLVFDCEDQDAAAAQLLREAVQVIVQLADALDPDGALPLVLRGSIGQRLAPRLAPATLARVVPALGDAMDGALRLFSFKGSFS